MTQMSEHLKRLDEITHTLPQFAETCQDPHTVPYVNHEGEEVARGFCLWNDGSYAVQRLFMEAGTEFEQHHHDEREWLLVISGEMTIELRGETHHLKRGDMLYCPPGVPHGGVSLTDSWTLWVSIPSAEGYPK